VSHVAEITMEELEIIEKEFHPGSSIIKSAKEFATPDELYQDLIRSIRKYHPSADISLVEKAYKVAFDAHDGQVRKSGEAYIIHPLCVAIILSELELDKETIAAGLLHDVLEDTKLTQKDMLDYGIPFCVVSRCEIIRRGGDESYMNFIERCAADKIVRYVKMADLLHNMDITRLEKITDKDFDRLKKYHKAYKYLKSLG
jgi:(p)ppGpp synthase/HD superfamily hydrolase